MNIKLNGTVYAVGVASVSRTLRRTEKYRVTTEDGRTHREGQATYMDFALNLGSFGAAVFDNVSDEIITEDEDGVLWDNLTLSFTGTEPLEV